MTIEQGEVWWGEASSSKGRPYLVLTRDEAIPVLRTVLVAPISRPADPHERSRSGSRSSVASVASMDGVLAFPKSMLVRRMGALAPERRRELGDALAAAIDR